MANDLEFLKKRTIEEFKADNNGQAVKVLRNPKTNKLFFTCGSLTGAVSSKGIPTEPMMSLVRDKKDPEAQPFWMLHEEGAGAPVEAIF